MRINAWSEVAAMVASFLGAVLVMFVWPTFGGTALPPWMRMSVVTVLTSVCWIVVTFATGPVPDAVVSDFKAKVRATGKDVGKGVVRTCLAVTGVFASLFAAGYLVYGRGVTGVLFTVLAAAVFFVLYLIRDREVNA